MSQVNPEMLTLARESRGFTQSELAKRLGVTQGKLSKVENGMLGTPTEMLPTLSEALDYPTDFFFQTSKIYGPGISELYHRKRQTLPKKVLYKTHAHINIRRMHISKLLRAVEIDECHVPHHDIGEYDGRVEEIARAVRASWRLPHGPITNLTQTIEDAGAVIIPCEFGTRKIDAISQWISGEPPMLFINRDLPGDRLRFSLSHELAHLVMHQTSHPDQEKQADRFAAEFLMPEADIKASLTNISLPKLATLKQHWKVSMNALLKRAGDLGRLTLSQTRYLWKKMSMAGYRTSEPSGTDIPQECPTLLQEIINAHFSDLKYSVSELSHVLVLHEHELRSLYPVPNDGSKPKPHLSLVKSSRRSRS